MRRAIRIRAKQDDLVWLKFLGDGASIASNDAQRNLLPEIEAPGWIRERIFLRRNHVRIIADEPGRRRLISRQQSLRAVVSERKKENRKTKRRNSAGLQSD